MLRRLHAQMVEESDTRLERKKSKRQRLVQLFRWKQKPQSREDVPTSVAVNNTTPREPSQESRSAKPTTLEQPNSSVDNARAPLVGTEEHSSPPTPPPSKEEKDEALSEAQIHTLFAGAPQFSIKETDGCLAPTIAYPWGGEGTTQDDLDSRHPIVSAFTAATLRKPNSIAPQPPEKQKMCHGYEVNTVEIPSMLSAQGIEPGSIGFSHFLELPISDSLVTDPEQSQSSKEFLEATRNKELMQTNPERIGIRPVEMNLVHDRLIEFQDLYEAFQDSPEPMTILNNQSSGDLYANLFSKFLTPPGYDDSGHDPTGLHIQIVTLIRILRLKGVWYDFSLVEWRIRLGQILWSDPEPLSEHEPQPLWTAREKLLLQITLACELLLRLDAVVNIEANGIKEQTCVGPDDIRTFFKIKSRKVDWDLVLARRFLDNILILRDNDADASSPQPKSRGLLSLLGVSSQSEAPNDDIVLLPQHQARQLSGLSQFAETLRWPNIDLFSKELALKLGMHDGSEQIEQRPSSSRRILDPITPSSISVYGTPLATPRSANHISDSYFGNVGKPPLSRHNSYSLRVPLSPSTISSEDRAVPVLNNIGGWLSRSYLTGLVLPGEAMSHFLISTLLENDKLAIATLGDSANLYGGFTWAGKTWWSKNSIVGRVLACIQGSAECMGWISCTQLPDGFTERWHSIHSEQLPCNDRLRTKGALDLVAHESGIAPGSSSATIKSEDFVLPSDLESLPTPSLAFAQWDLTPLNSELIDTDSSSDPLTESDIHIPSFTFISYDRAASHTLTLAYDVHFITSWPCTSPGRSAPAPTIGVPHVLKRSLTDTTSRSSSRRSETLSRRNSHGFEPLLSHPPDSADIAPKRMYSADLSEARAVQSQPMNAHPLHKSYLYKIASVTDILEPDFALPFAMHTSRPVTRPPSASQTEEDHEHASLDTEQAVLILDARASSVLELLARAWCAEKGLHAIIGRLERTCLACCIREARGLCVTVVIRV